MVFNSSAFLVFFLIFYALYWTLGRKGTATGRNVLILLASYLFYGWWDWRFLGLIFISSAVDFGIGLRLKNLQGTAARKAWLGLSVLVNLGILGLFKYYNFFVEAFKELLQLAGFNGSFSSLHIILPVGISFYTFQTLSYTIDVYKRKIEPTASPLSFFAFVSFFPQLVAGPIERASHLLPQFSHPKPFNATQQYSGLRLVLWGFFKKLVIADNFGLLADAIFSAENTLPGSAVLAGTLFFALQIYADFSGYSDIAIGISRLLGFDLMTNFRTPYFATSFSDFWRRWHISLSTWFRDYVYIPLGGNQKGRWRAYGYVLITFLLSGLWHGANFTFLLWGLLHGLALVLERHWRLNAGHRLYPLLVVLMVVLLWLPFRAENLLHLKELLLSLFHWQSYALSPLTDAMAVFSPQRLATLCLVSLLFLITEYQLRFTDFNSWLATRWKWQRWSIYYSLLLLILLLGNFTVKPNFIYFQF